MEVHSSEIVEIVKIVGIYGLFLEGKNERPVIIVYRKCVYNKYTYTKRTTAIFCLFFFNGRGIYKKSFCNQIINHIENQWNETASTCQLRKLKFHRSHNNPGRYVCVRERARVCVKTLYYTLATIKCWLRLLNGRLFIVYLWVTCMLIAQFLVRLKFIKSEVVIIMEQEREKRWRKNLRT